MTLSTFVLLLAASGQPPATAPAGTQPANVVPDNVLSGPAVDDNAGEPTLVRRSFEGTLEELDAEPGVAAVGLLDLSAQQREIHDRLLAERYGAFDHAVRENYGLIVELAAMSPESDAEAWIQVLNKLRAGFASFLRRGQFYDEMGPHLTDPQREQLNQMLVEYNAARMDQVKRAQGLAHQQAARRIMLETFGQMIRQSIERQVGFEREQFEQIAAELGLTEEQKNKAQAIFGPVAVKRLQNIDDAAGRAAAYREFNRILTPQQRRKALGILLKRWDPPPAATTQPQSRPADSMPGSGG